jgi:hypothetical protein
VKYFRIMSVVTAFIAVLTLGGAVVFSCLDEHRSAIFYASISALCGALKFLFDYLVNPNNLTAISRLH